MDFDFENTGKRYRWAKLRKDYLEPLAETEMGKASNNGFAANKYVLE